MMNIPGSGLIENIAAYVKCPDCGKKIALFGESHLDETAARYKLDILGSNAHRPGTGGPPVTEVR